MTIYLLKYNNYYNRTIKRFSTIDELLDRDDVVEIGTFENVNFNPGDGVATQLTLNYTEGPAANYLVAEDTDGSFTSWFVLDAQYVRFGQYQLTLRRDLVQDLWETLLDSPVFIEKATLSKNNPLFFNNEDMTFNQIKTKETLLKDKTGIPWIIGYVAPNTSITASVPIPGFTPDYTLTSLGQYDYYKWADWQDTHNALQVPSNYSLQINFYANNSSIFIGDKKYCLSWDKNGDPANYGDPSIYNYYSTYIYSWGDGQVGFPVGYAFRDAVGMVAVRAQPHIQSRSWTDVSPDTFIAGLGKDTDIATYNGEIGKVIKVGNDYYRITGSRKSTIKKMGTVSQSSNLGLRLADVVADLRNESVFSSTTASVEPAYNIAVQCDQYVLGFKKIANPTTYTLNVPADHEKSITPYDIFCIPYGRIELYGADSFSNEEIGYKLASDIIHTLGEEKLYDIQLLPYCPLPQSKLIDTEDGIGVIIDDVENGHELLKPSESAAATTTPPSALFWVKDPSFSFQIEADPLDAALIVPSHPTNAKVQYQTSFHRICSPNYNGTFEFSAIKNGGVKTFDVDCSYKPFSPYIRISPTFGGLYGQDFNDARGLILGGDFSLPRTSSEWRTYEQNNKNFQVMFDRQIDNIDINNNIQRTLEKWQVRTGTLQGATTGGIVGSMIPSAGFVGMGVGAAVGGIASAWGGAMDRKYNEQMRQEARDFTIDQFGYQLGNIQARPDNLTKVSSFNPNNKIFPVLEYYTATDTEKIAFRKKLEYNGMTVMAIGTISEYLQAQPSYIKGKLIRLNNDMEDYHIVNALADELYQGVYV